MPERIQGVDYLCKRRLALRPGIVDAFATHTYAGGRCHYLIDKPRLFDNERQRLQNRVQRQGLDFVGQFNGLAGGKVALACFYDGI